MSESKLRDQSLDFAVRIINLAQARIFQLSVPPRRNVKCPSDVKYGFAK